MKIIKSLSVVPVLVFVLSGCLATTDANDKVVLKNQEVVLKDQVKCKDPCWNPSGQDKTTIDGSAYEDSGKTWEGYTIKYAKNAKDNYSKSKGFVAVENPGATKTNKYDGLYTVDIVCDFGSISDWRMDWTIRDGKMHHLAGRWNIAGEVHDGKFIFDGQRQSGLDLGWYPLSFHVTLKKEANDLGGFVVGRGIGDWKGKHCEVVQFDQNEVSALEHLTNIHMVEGGISNHRQGYKKNHAQRLTGATNK